MAVFRTVPVASPEALLPGNTKPPGFTATGARPGGPTTLEWYAAFVDGDGAVVTGGSATVQWYAVEVGGTPQAPTYTTPTLGEAMVVDSLAALQKGVGQGLWPWCRVIDMTAPGGATHVQIRTTASASSEVVVDVPVPPDADTIQARCEAAIAAAVSDSVIPSDADVADVPDDTMAALDASSDALARVTASARAGIAAEVAANAIPSKADVAGVPGGTVTALDANSDPLARITASVGAELSTAAGTVAAQTQFGAQVSVVGAATADLLPASGDPAAFTDLLSVQISVTGATTVTINAFGEGPFYTHTYTAAGSAYISSDQFVFNGHGPLRRVFDTKFQISGSAGGVTVHATPRYRTTAV